MGRVHQTTRIDDPFVECLLSIRHCLDGLARCPRPRSARLRPQTSDAFRSSGAHRDHERKAPAIPRARSLKCRVCSGYTRAVVHFFVSMTTNPPPPVEISAQLITLCAAVMLVLQLLLVVQRMLLTSIRLFAIQSLFL